MRLIRLTYLASAALMLCAFATSAVSDECDPNDPTLLVPNLVALRPKGMNTIVVPAPDYVSNERLLRFTTSIGNAGKGPLILAGQIIDTPDGQMTQATQTVWRADGSTCTHVAGFFVHAEDDNDWHLNNLAAYQLRKDDPFTGEIVAQGTKVSFCLEDGPRLRGVKGAKHQVKSVCEDPRGIQGISVGYTDVYSRSLPDQWIDLDYDPANPVPAGDYFLVNIADPNGQLIRTADSPTTSWGVASVHVPAPPLPLGIGSLPSLLRR